MSKKSMVEISSIGLSKPTSSKQRSDLLLTKMAKGEKIYH
jgi:hypothetical protein